MATGAPATTRSYRGRWSASDEAGPMSTVRLVLARHAESVWNVEERYQGQADSGLTPRGRRQAEELGAWLAESVGPVTLVLSSDSPRAAATAAPYAARTRQRVKFDPRLREVDTGSWTGRSFPEIAAAFPAVVRAAADGDDVRRGDGETFAELWRRVGAALDDGAAAADAQAVGRGQPTVCVFTHGGPIRVAAAAVVGAAAPGHRAMAPPTNCSVTVLEVPRARRGLECGQLVQYNAQVAAADRPSRAE